jgi:hypothetical protein
MFHRYRVIVHFVPRVTDSNPPVGRRFNRGWIRVVSTRGGAYEERSSSLPSADPLPAVWVSESVGARKVLYHGKSKRLNNGVVILDILKAGKAYQLQCNQSMADCTSLKNGKYQMVELPKNFGMYECQDVEVYPESAVTLDKDQKLGEYCLVEK